MNLDHDKESDIVSQRKENTAFGKEKELQKEAVFFETLS
jgi:hypothetical protein